MMMGFALLFANIILNHRLYCLQKIFLLISMMGVLLLSTVGAKLGLMLLWILRLVVSKMEGESSERLVLLDSLYLNLLGFVPTSMVKLDTLAPENMAQKSLMRSGSLIISVAGMFPSSLMRFVIMCLLSLWIFPYEMLFALNVFSFLIGV